MKILAIDTCSNHFSVGVSQNNILTSKIIELEPNKQAERLVLSIESTLLQSKISYQDLDAVTLTIGPGSFTGIKMGLAAAYAISAVQSIPCIGFSTLEVLAEQLGGNCTMTVAAGRGRYYCQSFDQNNEPANQIQLLESTEISKLDTTLKGDFISNQVADIEILCKLAYAKLRTGQMIELPQPIYSQQTQN